MGDLCVRHIVSDGKVWLGLLKELTNKLKPLCVFPVLRQFGPPFCILS